MRLPVVPDAVSMFRALLVGLWLAAAFSSGSVQASTSPAAVVRAALSVPESDLDYTDAKLIFDRIIDPDLDDAAVIARVDRLTEAASRMAAGANDIDRLRAVRQVIYDAGEWNGGRPFTYDHADPFGTNLRNKLLATYFETRRGNCVSMPILHLIVAERLGLNVTLSTAPHHIFMRYTNPVNGRSIAIEPTSGGHPAREAWYRDGMGITDAQVASGIYLGQLTKRESIAVMASTVTEWLMSEGRYQDVIDVADVILEYNPRDVHALLQRGLAHAELLRTEYYERYPTPAEIPSDLWPRYEMLAARNAADFGQAEAWGWMPSSEPQ